MRSLTTGLLLTLVGTGVAGGAPGDAARPADRVAQDREASAGCPGVSLPGGIPICRPATLTSPGKYVVVRNISAPGTVLDVRGRGVDLDLNGFTIESTTDGPAAIVVFPPPPQPEIEDVTIANGSVRGGNACLFVDRVVRFTMRDLKTGGCTAGVQIDDLLQGAVIEGNEIGRDTAEQSGLVIGNCANCRVSDNTITGGIGQGLSVGFAVGGEISGNRVRASSQCYQIGGDGVRVNGNVAAQCVGAMRIDARYSLVENNMLSNAGTGLTFGVASLDNLYRGNVARNVTEPLVDEGTGNSSGGDNYLPGRR